VTRVFFCWEQRDVTGSWAVYVHRAWIILSRPQVYWCQPRFMMPKSNS